jgi:hypothetical protein
LPASQIQNHTIWRALGLISVLPARLVPLRLSNLLFGASASVHAAHISCRGHASITPEETLHCWPCTPPCC